MTGTEGMRFGGTGEWVRLTRLLRPLQRIRRRMLTAALAVMAGCGGVSSVGRGDGVSSPGGSNREASLATATRFVRSVDAFPVRDQNGRMYNPPFLGGFNVPRPQFAAIDGDGDVDLFLQERPDELIFFENVGSPTRPDFVWPTDR